MLVSLSGTQIWQPETNRNIFFRVRGRETRGRGGGGYLSVNSSLEELIKIEVILILYHQDKEYLDSKISKNPHKSLPCHQLNATSRKSLEIQASSIANEGK